jgi:carbamoyltransferase
VKARAGELAAERCQVEWIDDEDELCRRTAMAIEAGQVIGWFQGRMEWGPRALGNRSILGDPRRADMKDILNLKIKRRESFRPFAPSILREATAEWFEQDGDVPFMMQVFQIRADKRSLIPAVTHVDGSGRLQTVDASSNPRYHKLISDFRQRTGVPMVLNTSFNENEPVVCQPQEALDCFLRTRMDVLVLGNTFINRVP